MSETTSDSSSSANDTTMPDFQASDLAVSLTVNDLESSLKWYTEVIGFAITQKHEREGTLRAVSLKAGNTRLLLGQDDGAKGLDRIKGEGFSMQFTTDQDIDEIADRIKEHGGALETEPTDMPWGPRVFRVLDPDGFRLVFSTGNKKNE